jgi:hypothetical protein
MRRTIAAGSGVRLGSVKSRSLGQRLALAADGPSLWAAHIRRHIDETLNGRAHA